MIDELVSKHEMGEDSNPKKKSDSSFLQGQSFFGSESAVHFPYFHSFINAIETKENLYNNAVSDLKKIKNLEEELGALDKKKIGSV